MSLLWKRLHLVALTLLAPTSALAGEVTLELRPDVVVGNAQITLADLAQVQAADTAVQQQLRTLVMGQSPMVGHVEQRSRATLELQLRSQAYLMGQTIVWRGAQSTTVRRASQSLDTGALLAVARQAVQERFGTDAEVRMDGVLPDLGAPDGELHYLARLAPQARLRARMPVWVDVSGPDGLYRSVVLPLMVSMRREVYVARRELPAGSMATPADFEVRREDIAALQETALANGSLVVGARVREALAPGQVVTTRQVAPPDMVLRGDHVVLKTAAAGIAIETSAYAQADAVIGQAVQVRPEHSKEVIVARVTGPGEVSMDGR